MTMPAASPTALAPTLAGRRLGRYEVLTQLASGGMAGVYVGRAQGVAGFERLVAIKVLHPHLAHEQEFITMFLDEARLAARIRHPNVVATLDISDTEGAGYFLVMDYIEGDHLGALLRESAAKHERLKTRVVARIMIDALIGLGAAHELKDERGRILGLIHRDVSPHNILAGTDGVSRLSDFGVAKAEVRLSSTREGQFKGKLGYMAPEHASNGISDRRSDLFSMGIILWESLAGKRLFRGENNAATLNKILSMPIPPPSAIVPSHAPYDAVLARALARPSEQRFESAEEFIEAIELAARDAGGIASAREVAETVREYAKEKLGAERARIQKALEEFGYSELTGTPLPIPRDGSSPGVGIAHVGSGSGIHAPILRTEPNMPAERPAPPSSSKWLFIAAGAVVLVLLLAAVGAIVGLTGDDEPAASPPPVPRVAEEPRVEHVTAAMDEPPAAMEPEAQIEEPPALVVTPEEEPEERPDRERRDRGNMRRSRDAMEDEPEARVETAMVETSMVEAEPQMTESMTEPSMEPSMMGMAGDDLILNPYQG
jgi:serine/threonine protein kinase